MFLTPLKEGVCVCDILDVLGVLGVLGGSLLYVIKCKEKVWFTILEVFFGGIGCWIVECWVFW